MYITLQDFSILPKFNLDVKSCLITMDPSIIHLEKRRKFYSITNKATRPTFDKIEIFELISDLVIDN